MYPYYILTSCHTKGDIPMDDLNHLNSTHFDILKEIGNIGSGNGVTALSKIIGRKVRMKTPVVVLAEFKDVAAFLGGPEQLVIGILVGISGDINGIMMFLTKVGTARKMLEILMGPAVPGAQDGEEFTGMELSALKEIGNIMASSYIGSLAGLIGKEVRPSVPYLSLDMANAILSVPATEFGKSADRALLIETLFEAEGENVSGYCILAPDVTSFQIIMRSLGAE